MIIRTSGTLSNVALWWNYTLGYSIRFVIECFCAFHTLRFPPTHKMNILTFFLFAPCIRMLHALVRMSAMNQLWCLILVLPLRLTHYILSNEFHQTEATDTSKAAKAQAEKVSSMENTSKDKIKNENDPNFLRLILTGWLVYILKSFQIIYISFIQNGH